MVKIILSIVVLVISLNANEVNIYSHRHYPSDEILFKKFTEKTGIKVNVVKANADQIMKRLEEEGKYSPADLLLTVDVGRLYYAKEKGLLQPIKSKFLEEVIPSNLRDKEGYWFGVTKRARVIVYNVNTVDPKSLSTYEALSSKEYKGSILTRSSTNIYNQSLLASIIAHKGEKEAKAWAKGIKENFARKPTGSDRDQMRALAAGIADIAIVNTYYVGNLLNSDKFSDREVAKNIGIFFPNQGENERGAHINISGIGVTKYAKNRDNAIKFIEFLCSEESQKVFSSLNYEYPVNKNVSPSKLLQSWGSFKEDDIELYKLGQNNAKAVKIFNEVGWQ
ncbi:Fe(3+) ABC transporter substrate-binding protein [Sulfurimonas sp.]|uniref:Fe(3+) ABC transporter substrate-binding protein n=1 Tax=Sulfurimonas sp. TaxID=2022749 RepID=UPI002B496418|nr:Fe(3+) ABC transporter substrate-binding protein [Sulfurimonas sp.]